LQYYADVHNLVQIHGLVLETSLPAALRSAQAAGIYFTQRPILRFFAPEGRHVAPMGVKFRMEVPSSMPNFTPIGATTRL